jgi:hypothetical protein
MIFLKSSYIFSEIPKIKANPEESDTGYYKLIWESKENGIFELEETSSNKTKIIYKGKDKSTVISGKNDGDYNYRIRLNDGTWSESITVTVKHHNPFKAILFLCFGFFVFIITATMILIGYFHHRKESRDQT